jgi:hypothetical protein
MVVGGREIEEDRVAGHNVMWTMTCSSGIFLRSLSAGDIFLLSLLVHVLTGNGELAARARQPPHLPVHGGRFDGREGRG